MLTETEIHRSNFIAVRFSLSPSRSIAAFSRKLSMPTPIHGHMLTQSSTVAQAAQAETHCSLLVTIRTPIRCLLNPFTAMRSVPSRAASMQKPPTSFDDDGLPSLKIDRIYNECSCVISTI